MIRILWALLLASPAQAGDPAQAAALKAEADQRMLARDYPAALKKLEEAYAADPQPRLIANQGVVYRYMGRFAEAVETLERFLATNPPGVQARKAEGIIAELRPPVEVLSDPNGATLRRTDTGAVLGETPLKTHLVVGTYPIELSLEGYAPLTLELEVREGRPTAVRRTLIAKEDDVELTEVIVQTPGRTSRGGRVWSFVTLGIGVAAVGAAGALYALGSGAVEDRDAARSGAAWDEHQQAAEGYSLGMWAAAGVGAAALAASGVLFALEGRGETAVRVGPRGLSLGGRF